MAPLNSKLGVSAALAVGLGLCLWLWSRRKKQLKQRGSHVLTTQTSRTHTDAVIEIVSSAEQWARCVPKLLQELEKHKVLGLDCEWVLRRPVALLQISTSCHYCVLVRLCFIHKSDIPQSLKTLLADRSILKVGVSVRNDASKLLRDYGLQVNGCVDLRDVLTRVRGIFSCEKVGLQGLAKGVLGIHISKDTRIRCGNWEANKLNAAQIDYAAMDAMVGVDIFCNLVLAKIIGQDPRHNSEAAAEVAPEMVLSVTRGLCQGIVDIYTSAQHENLITNPNKNKHKQANQNKKLCNNQYAVRKRPLWDNCELMAPDGQLLCTIDLSKADWYIKKGLGEKISDDPVVVKLHFEPSGRPKSNRDYYLQPKDNMCVVCGDTEQYARKYIVPQEYRKYFPRLLKWHTSHDILLMCPTCHRKSSSHDSYLRMQLAEECGAPLNSGENSSIYQDHYLQQVKSAGRALKHNRDKIPAARVKELEKVLFDYYGVLEISEDVIKMAAVLDIKQEKEGHVNHAKKVVEYLAEHGGLLEFQARWRRHFLHTMEPQFLPAFWSVDYVPENWETDGASEDQEEGAEGQGEGERDYYLKPEWCGGGQEDEEEEDEGQEEWDEDDEERELVGDDFTEDIESDGMR